MTTTDAEARPSIFVVPPGADAQESRFIRQLPQMTEAEIYEKLGYNGADTPSGLDKARTDFKANHPGLAGADLDAHNNPSMQKLEHVMYQAILDRDKFQNMGAEGITPAQAYGIRTAAQNTHVKPESIATLAIAERAFDPTFTASPTGANAPADPHSGLQSPSRQPGMIQMTDDQWLETVRDSGNKFPGTEVSRLADEINKMTPPDSHGHRPGVDSLDASHAGRTLMAEALALRNNPVVSAEIGSEYAKTAPSLQLDIMKTYAGYTSGGNDAQLSSLLKNMGISQADRDVALGGNNWCAVMANSVLSGVGDPRSDSFAHPVFTEDGTKGLTLAGDFENYGKGVSDPTKVKAGDVVVFRDANGSQDGDWYSHVAIVSKVDPVTGTFSWIGGNQGNQHSVNEHGGETGNLYAPDLTFRRPPPNAFAAAATQHEAAEKLAAAKHPKPASSNVASSKPPVPRSPAPPAA